MQRIKYDALIVESREGLYIITARGNGGIIETFIFKHTFKVGTQTKYCWKAVLNGAVLPMYFQSKKEAEQLLAEMKK